MGARDVSKGTVKSIYALGAKLGMVERGGGHADALHALVQGLTGKESITALTPAEAQAVLAELRRRSAPAAAPQKKRARKYEALPGGLSEGQQKKVWYLMYQLEKYDPAPEGVHLRDRLCGLISRQFGVTAFPTQPFRFLTFSQGNALICKAKHGSWQKPSVWMLSGGWWMCTAAPAGCTSRRRTSSLFLSVTD